MDSSRRMDGCLTLPIANRPRLSDAARTRKSRCSRFWNATNAARSAAAAAVGLASAPVGLSQPLAIELLRVAAQAEALSDIFELDGLPGAGSRGARACSCNERAGVGTDAGMIEAQPRFESLLSTASRARTARLHIGSPSMQAPPSCRCEARRPASTAPPGRAIDRARRIVGATRTLHVRPIDRHANRVETQRLYGFEVRVSALAVGRERRSDTSLPSARTRARCAGMNAAVTNTPLSQQKTSKIEARIAFFGIVDFDTHGRNLDNDPVSSLSTIFAPPPSASSRSPASRPLVDVSEAAAPAALSQVREPAAGRGVQDPRRVQHGGSADRPPSVRPASSPTHPAITARRWRSPPASSARRRSS